MPDLSTLLGSIFNIEPWWRFALAALIGALVGLEREYRKQQKKDPSEFAGIRTFALIALMGAVTAYLYTDFGILPALVAFVGLILLVTASYAGDFITTHEIGGITTEITAMIVFLFGTMVFWTNPEIPVSLAVITALILAAKAPLHQIARRMSAIDLRVTLQFLLLAAVILPVLPNRTIDPFDILNPAKIWLLVVFVSGIGFAGYIAMNIMGAEKGIGLTGILGGIVSSTATTLSFSTRSKENPTLSTHFAQAVLLACSVMFPRVIIEVFIIDPPLAKLVALPLILMLLTGLGAVFFIRRKLTLADFDEDKAVELANPLKISTAVMFGLVFAVVLTVVNLAQNFFGDTGVYLASFITGLTDVDAITLSVSQLTHSGALEQRVAVTSILIASIMNTTAKAGIVYAVGCPELRRIALRAFALIIVTGIISGGVLLLTGGF